MYLQRKPAARDAKRATLLEAGVLFVAAWLRSETAVAEDAAALTSLAPPQQASQDASGDPEGSFVQPLDRVQLIYGYKTAPGGGAAKGTLGEVTTESGNLRADWKFTLDPQWEVGLSGDLSFLAKNPINASNPNGDFLHGIGDSFAQAVLVREIDARWAAGFGARLVAPTGGSILGTGKWRILPGAAARYALPEISNGSYFEPLVRYDVSFAGNPTKRNINNVQFAPTVNLGLPEGWFLALFPSPDIRVNLGDPITGQTGRLFLPFDARIGRKINNNVNLSLEVAAPIVRDYPVYDFKTEVRLNLRF